MAAVVLRDHADTAPESIIGPFATLTAAEAWARANPRQGGYCVAEKLTPPDAAEGADGR